MTLRFSRRRLLVSALGAGLLAALPETLSACSSDPPVALEPRKVIQKDVHIATSKARLVILTNASHVELRVGLDRHRAVPHTPETLAAWRAARAGGGGGALKAPIEPSHFVEDARFSAVGTQSFTVYAMQADGSELLFAGGIHVASAQDRRRARLSTESGDDGSDDDPQLIIDDDACAIWAVFHNPHVMAHDLDTAARVIELIQQTPDYSALVAAIGAFPDAEDADNARYAGWVYGRPRSYKKLSGETVMVTEVDWSGNPIVDDAGNPRPAIDWELSPYAYPTLGLPRSVKELAMSVTDQVMTAFNDRPDEFEGVKYIRAAPVTGRGDAPLSGLAKGSGLGDADAEFTFSSQGRTDEHRKLTVEPRGSSFNVTLDNYLALGCLYGVSHFDHSGALLATHTLGYAGSTYYPSLTRLVSHSSSDSDFERPEQALTSTLWTYSPGLHDGDFGPHGDKIELGYRSILTWAVSLIADLLIPGYFLAMGVVDADEASSYVVKSVVLDALKSGGEGALADLVADAFNTAYGIAAGSDPVTTLLDGTLDVLKILFRLAEQTALRELFLVAIAKAFAKSEIKTAGAMATPLIGWAIYAGELALTTAQLAVSTAHLIGNRRRTNGVLRYTHPLEITIRPQDSTYFFSAARFSKYSVSAARDADGADFVSITQGATPVVVQRDGAGREFIVLQVSSVPIVAKLKIEVSLVDSAGAHANVIGSAVLEVDNVDAPGKEQRIDLDIEMKPLPVDGQMGLLHDVILRPSPTGWTWSAAGAPAPVGDVDPFTCATGSLCALDSLTVRQTKDQAGRIAFNYQTSCSTGASPMMAAVRMALSVATQTERPPVTESPCVGPGARLFLYGLNGTSVILVQPAGQRARVYLPPSSGDEVDLAAWTESTATLYAQARGGAIAGARLTPDGKRLLIAYADKVEVMALDVADAASRSGLLFGDPGSAKDCISACTAVAGFHHEDQIAVLDAGNYRVSVFDHAGAYVPYFGTSDGYLTPNQGGGNHVLLDIDIDVAGNAWVLSSQPHRDGKPTPYLSIYGKSGERLVSFSTLDAGRFALDRFNQVFSLNRQAVVAAGYASPTVSRWVPTHPSTAA